MTRSPADDVHDALLARGETLAVAESLTGGLLAAALTAVPGVSATFRGGVVAYATELKAGLLGVDAGLLDRVGPVDPLVAAGMAAGARERLRATYGLATTGIAGPDPQDGHLPGEVYVAVSGPGGELQRRLDLAGDRAAVRDGAVTGALRLLADVLADPGSSGLITELQ